jgi:GT2 family glycosyltransferase
MTIVSLPRLSVVIACYNQTRELERTLTSFLHQSLPHTQYELIVVDDHSADYTARETVARLRQKFPAARLLYVRQHRVDGGSYGASAKVKNVGVRLARGEHVFFNNAEIVQAGESMTHILRVMDDADRPLCLRGRVIDLPFENLAGRTQAELEANHDRAERARERVATADHAGLAAMPRALLLAVGGNDERFDYWGKEDLDLAARLKRAGATYVYDEQLKSFHISHPPNHVKQGDYLRMCALLEENNARGLVEANRGRLWGTLNAPPVELLDGTIIVESGADTTDLARRLEAALYCHGAERAELLVVCLDSERAPVEALLEERFRSQPLIALAPEYTVEHAARCLRQVRTEKVAFLPVGASFTSPAWANLCADAAPLVPWHTGTTRAEATLSRGWLGLKDFLLRLGDIGPPQQWGMDELAARAQAAG